MRCFAYRLTSCNYQLVARFHLPETFWRSLSCWRRSRMHSLDFMYTDKTKALPKSEHTRQTVCTANAFPRTPPISVWVKLRIWKICAKKNIQLIKCQLMSFHPLLSLRNPSESFDVHSKGTSLRKLMILNNLTAVCSVNLVMKEWRGLSLTASNWSIAMDDENVILFNLRHLRGATQLDAWEHASSCRFGWRLRG